MKLTFTPSEVKDILKVWYSVGDLRSVLLLGGSGIGKTTLVRELAMELAECEGMDFLEVSNGVDFDSVGDDVFLFYSMNLSTKEPYDLEGVPRDVDELSFRYKVLEAFKVMKGRKGILFLDEVTNVRREDMHTALYSLFQFKRAGDLYLGDDVWVIGAGNRREDSKFVTEFSNPEINRVKVVNVGVPKIGEWVEWMDRNYSDEWDRVVGAFLMRFSSYVHKPNERGRGLVQWPSLRNWTDVAVYGKRIGDSVGYNSNAYVAHVLGLVGNEAGSQFLVFRNLINEMPSFEIAVKNPAILGDVGLDVMYLFAVEMANRIRSSDDFERYSNLVGWVLKNRRELFMVYWQLIPKGVKKEIAKVMMVRYPDYVDVILEVKKKKYGL